MNDKASLLTCLKNQFGRQRPMLLDGHVEEDIIGIFGGLSQWGLLGLFIGPLILSIGMFLLDIYRSIVLKKQCKNDRETILE